MSKSNEMETALLELIFNNTALANVGTAAGLQPSATPGNFYLSLHTGDPLDTVSDPTATETAYTNYARQSIARAAGAGGFTITGDAVSPFDDTDFPECGATPGGAITHFCILGGITNDLLDQFVLYYGTVTPNITMATGVIPRIKNTSTITED